MNHIEGPTTFAHLVRELSERWPDREALVFDGAGVREHVRCTYQQLWDRSRRLASGLLASGLKQGDHFALVMANHLEFIECMVAAGISGLVFVSMDPRMKAERLAEVMRHSNVRAAVVADYAMEAVVEARKSVPDLAWLVVLDSGEVPTTAQRHGFEDYTSFLERFAPAVSMASVSGEHPMQLIYTSGTTGNPKGILMTHDRYVNTSLSIAKTFGYSAQDRLYSALSLTHANAQLLTLGAGFSCGLPVVFSRRFSKSALWDVLRRHQCTTFTLLGGMTSAIYAHPPCDLDTQHAVRFVVSAGMPEALWRAFERRFGLRVLEFWGTAEGGITVNPIDKGPVGSIGKPVPMLMHRVVDEDDQPVSLGKPGELQIRHADGRPFVVAYFSEPEASHRKCQGGWMRSGDVVHEDADGWLHFHHRRGAGIRRNGEFVSPAVIERAIAESMLAADVYVYGLQLQSNAPGEKHVVAAVVPAGAGFSKALLMTKLRSRLESSQLPDILQVVQEIPKTASEKPQDRFLIQQLSLSAIGSLDGSLRTNP